MAQAVSGDLFCGAGGYWAAHPGHSVRGVHCYNITANRWRTLPRLPADRAGGGLIIVGRTLIFAGGCDREHDSLEKHVDYGDTWTFNMDKPWEGWRDVAAKMPDPRNHMGAVNTCGRLFWVGGQHKEEEVSGNRRSVSEFVLKTRTWRKAAPLPYPLGHISASVMPFRCGVLIVAGVTNGRRSVTDVQWLSPYDGRWHRIGYYPIPVATPVCGLHRDTVMCATGGTWHTQNLVFVAKIY